MQSVILVFKDKYFIFMQDGLKCKPTTSSGAPPKNEPSV